MRSDVQCEEQRAKREVRPAADSLGRRSAAFAPRPSKQGFTLIEVMMAMFIFAMILIAIYSTWILILKGTDAGGKAAAAVQRSRVAIRTIEDALLTVQMFNSNMTNYLFVADTSGDMAAISMVSHLPESFPGVGRYGDQVVRRVSFYTSAGKDGTELMMTQAPMLMETNTSVQAYTITLAKDVSLFRLDFYDMQKDEWLDEWKYTNQLPKLVQVTLGLGKSHGVGSQPQDVVTRLVALPSVAVLADVQGIGPGVGLPPGGVPPPGTTQPGVPGTGQPGTTQPGYYPPGYTGQPGSGQPGYSQPGIIQPGFGQPGSYGQPGFPNRQVVPPRR
jgi:prepilin-type N-terminal cleavage/methylation domain-containing protein